MNFRIQNLWRKQTDSGLANAQSAPSRIEAASSTVVDLPEMPVGDPLLAYLQGASDIVQLDKLAIDSPALAALKAAGFQLAIPLVNQGQLIGILNLGARLSEQQYTSDDHRLLLNLTAQAAPALRVAQLVRQQQLEARQRERIEQELRMARIIQETLLPQRLPDLPGWRVSVHWQPAQAVGGDFYDFIGLPDNRLGIVIGDVTDKGIPAALVMASTRSILRSSAERFAAPGRVLEHVNNLLCQEMPPKMFVTCLYAIFEPDSGHFWFANAGHNLPGHCSGGKVTDLWARGMPLGLLPNMHYEEAESWLAPGDSILLYSDGLVEAHNPAREMFGFSQLQQLLVQCADDHEIIERLKRALADFVGPTWVQEDDVTLVLIERQPLLSSPEENENEFESGGQTKDASGEQVIARFSLASLPGNEREAAEQVATAVLNLGLLSPRQIERLKTATAEAIMNAMEHGNRYDSEKRVEIAVRNTQKRLVVSVTDQGRGPIGPTPPPPDLQAKLAGEQPPRGWGLWLIQNMADEMNVIADDHRHTLELIFYH